jgi:hypothetical protein
MNDDLGFRMAIRQALPELTDPTAGISAGPDTYMIWPERM